MPMPQDLIALDRVPSSRTITADGHMRVTGSAVSKSNVCVYRGNEIPGYQALGLDARKEYRLYRDPAELEKAADSLNGKPLLVLHRPVTAGDHAPELVVGALDNTRWDAPYLRADLTIWSQDAIDLVDSGEQRELSCAYRYVPVMRSGTSPDGEAFDAVMTAIDFNHCCLVADGRAGPDVHVGDSALPPTIKEIVAMAKTAALSRTALFASGALRAYLRPKLAADAKIDLAKIVTGVTAKTFKADKPKLKLALDAAVKDKLAKDATLSDVDEILDELQEAINDVADEPEVVTPPLDDDAETEEEKTARLAKRAADKAAKDETPEAKAAREKAEKDKDMITKPAMDAAIAAAVTKATSDAEASTIARLNGIREAEAAVRPLIGELAVAQDSAEAVYKFALDKVGGVDLTGVPPAAYRAMVAMLPRPGDAPNPRPMRGAMDAAGAKKLAERFPNMNRLQKH
jgi:hypothetical protein